MALISLYQMGIIEHLPEPPLPHFDADKVDAAAEAYAKLSTPDAVIGLGNYAATLGLAAMGGQDRATERPWIPLALAAKVAFDAVQAGKLSVDQWTEHRAFCFWCLLAAGSTFAAVPLVVPEANAHAARNRPGNLIANPNCTTAAVVVALAPIRDLAGLASVDLASYQAVSGAGRKGLDAFDAERASEHRERAADSPFHGRIADSVVPQIDVLDEHGWTGEENKIHAELRKILEMPSLDVAATTVRVPVHTGHSVALHIRTERDTTVAELEAALRSARGLEYRPADGSERHPMPLDIEGRDPVLVGRLRAIPGRERGFALWVSSDNLRKGAALNAIQSAAAADPERFGRLLPPPR